MSVEPRIIKVKSAINDYHVKPLTIRLYPDGSSDRTWVRNIADDCDEPELVEDLSSTMDWVLELDHVFVLTCDGPARVAVEGGTVQEVYDLLYNLPIPGGDSFVSVGECGCMMGECGIVTTLEEEPRCSTFKQAIALWGSVKNDTDTGIEYYEGPEWMGVSLNRIDSIRVLKNEDNTDAKHCGAYSATKTTHMEEVHPPEGCSWVTWQYCR